MATRKNSRTSSSRRRSTPLRKSPPVKHAPIDEREEEPAPAPQKPELSPIDASMLLLIERSEETERLVYELTNRLVPILRKSEGETGAHGSTSTDIPLVDALMGRANHAGTINSHLLDLLDRLAL